MFISSIVCHMYTIMFMYTVINIYMFISNIVCHMYTVMFIYDSVLILIWLLRTCIYTKAVWNIKHINVCGQHMASDVWIKQFRVEIIIWVVASVRWICVYLAKRIKFRSYNVLRKLAFLLKSSCYTKATINFHHLFNKKTK